MPTKPRQSSSSVQVTFRIRKEILAETDRVARLWQRADTPHRLSRPVTRNDALRLAIACGLEVLQDKAFSPLFEQERNAKAKRAKTKTKRAQARSKRKTS